jgi:DNA-binding NarL/FixJ family response regulator
LADATLERGRATFQQRKWGEAFALLSAAHRATPLEPPDLERLATAAFLLGRDDESRDFLTLAHQLYQGRGDAAGAARCAFWVAFGLLEQGEPARGGGWLARARRLLEDSGEACVEQGYLLVPQALEHVARREFAAAHAVLGDAAAIGAHFDDRDLVTLARQGQGRALIRLGRIPEGVALLDEVMVGVAGGEVSPVIAGIVYCSVLSACHEMYDWQRAQEWTAALSRWCESQPDLVPYRGQCLVRRAEVLQLRGDWPAALEEAQRACARLSQPSAQPAVGAALYQVAELHRLRGDFTAAETAYRSASQWRKPQPGLALLRLAQGQLDTAHAAIRGALDEVPAGAGRAPLLAAGVDIALAAGDVPAAESAARELSALAQQVDAPYLRALAAQAEGSVRLSQGRPREALVGLRRAWAGWRDLDAPYQAARVRVLIASACEAQGDRDTAELEFEAARSAFDRLGAASDLARLTAPTPGGAAELLTARERQVLTLVASGRTNRRIAAALDISEKTVARHVSNIFRKLDVTSRAAATAFAYEHGLAPRHST